MTQVNHQIFDFTLANKQARHIFIAVLLVHLLISLLAAWGLPDFNMKKRPDLIIELGASMPAASVTTNSSANKSPSPKIEKNIEPQQKLDRVGERVVSQQSSDGVSSSVSSTASMGNAPVVDADYKAAYLNNPKPPYPAQAYRMRVQGKVILLVEVLPSGQAGRVSLEVSSGNELLDKSALETVKKWHFSPAKKDGVVIPQIVKVPISFNLTNK